MSCGKSCVNVSQLLLNTLTMPSSVADGPELDEAGCPSNQTWLERTLQKLSCQAEGFPIPDVSCMKDGKVWDTRRMQNVTQSHAGVYLCNASNAHGSRSKMVTVQVECKCVLLLTCRMYGWIVMNVEAGHVLAAGHVHLL